MQRRDFLKASLASASVLGSTTLTPARSEPAAASGPATGGIDTNVSLGQWPFRRLPLDRTDALLAKMAEHGIATAWAGSFEGLLHRDIAGVNQRLADECRQTGGRLLPFGSINLALPNWEDDVRRCAEIHRMRGIRLHPNYHGYTLADPRFTKLLVLATERALLVQIAVLMEDTRTHHPLMVVPDVEVTPLADAMRAVSGARVQLLNSGKILDGPAATRLGAMSGVYFDLARVESAAGVGRQLRRLPAGRLVFGTHAPFFIYESAIIKLYESELTDAEARALLVDNPRRLLG